MKPRLHVFWRFVYIKTARACIRILPVSWVLRIAIVASALGLLRFAGRVTHIEASSATRPFMGVVQERRLGHVRPSSFRSLARLFPAQTSAVLNRLGYVDLALDVLSGSVIAKSGRQSTYGLANALFDLGEFDQARRVLAQDFDRDRRPDCWHAEAQLELIAGNEGAALSLLRSAAKKMPWIRSPFQNFAQRYDAAYEPTALDRKAGDAGYLYDALSLVGRRLTDVGFGSLGAQFFASAVGWQRELRKTFPELSPALRALLARLKIEAGQFHLLPPEWAAEIGRFGMLDMLLRMRDLGWWSGDAVLLASPRHVANGALLDLFRDRCVVLMPPESIATETAAELSSLQRWCGISVNAIQLRDGKVVPTPDACALAVREWEAQGRGYPLREQFDRRPDDTTRASVAALRQSWGMGPEDWYVCFDARAVPSHRAADSAEQADPHASLGAYAAAIRFVVERGGWVIQMADADAPLFQAMERFVDYGRGDFKSEALDLQLLSGARYFIGTSSGLANVAVAFGLPCALVDCLTAEPQPWGGRVRFALKRVSDAEGNLLTQHALTDDPWRGRMISAAIMSRFGATTRDNTADEVLETVKEIDALAGATDDPAERSRQEALFQPWRASLSVPHFYGNALPSSYFLRKWDAELRRQDDLQRRSGPVLDTSAALQGL